jgi:hypothetical protein
MVEVTDVRRGVFVEIGRRKRVEVYSDWFAAPTGRGVRMRYREIKLQRPLSRHVESFWLLEDIDGRGVPDAAMTRG